MGVLVLSTLLLVFARLYHPRKFAFFLTLPFNSGVREFEEEFNPNGVRDPFDILLTLNSYLVFGAGIFLILTGEWGDWLLFTRVLFLLLLFFLSKSFAELFLAWLFQVQEGVVAAQNTALVYRCWIALWISPLLVVHLFTPGAEGLTKSILIIVLLSGYVMSLLLSSLRLWNLVSGTYYKILYLCALELVPFFFLVSWLKSL